MAFVKRDAQGRQVEQDRCHLCGTMSKRTPHAGKRRYKHNCPHGVRCPSSVLPNAVHINNYPVAGGCDACRDLGSFSSRTWERYMRSIVKVASLQDIAVWWADAYLWRTAEMEAGRGNPYDWSPGGRVPRSVVRTKFQIKWTTEIEGQLSRLILEEAKRRGYKDLLKEARRWKADERLTSLGF